MDYNELDIEKMMTLLSDREAFWNQTIIELSKQLNCSAKDVIPLQAQVISIRQQLTEEIKKISYEIFKFLPKIKLIKKQRYEYYHTQYKIITNASEKMKLIEWDIANYDHKKDILDGHIEFLRDSLKNIDNLNYAVKNKITLYQLTDLE